MTKKYQVFISSTYTDLVAERRAVEETIIRAGDIPVGMEVFPAADEEQFEFIKTVIDDCDYYVLIIAGRYGSLAPDGLSYTEKEYHYAVEKGVPVLVMLREDRGALPQSKCEDESQLKEKLEAFINIASSKRLRKGWSTIDGLKLAVRESLDHAKKTKKRPGWVRGDQAASAEQLQKLVDVREENERLKAELDEARPNIPKLNDLADLETSLSVSVKFDSGRKVDDGWGRKVTRYSPETFSTEATFGKMFGLVAPKLLRALSDSLVSEALARSLYEELKGERQMTKSFSLADQDLETLKIQLMALGLVTVTPGRSTKGNMLLFWRLTSKGVEEMYRLRAVKA